MATRPTTSIMTEKYGLFCYDTNNIGDEIQSIAARQFLPRIDYYINRDNIDEVCSRTKDNIKVIMNGWYMSASKSDNIVHWPPQSPNLSPLLISMHIDSLNGTTSVFSKKPSLTFLKKYSPVGARDLDTLKFLQSMSIPAYFSGCLTLTLNRDPNISKMDFILAIDVSDKTYRKILSSTNRKVIRIDAAHNSTLTTDEKFSIAEYWLFLYQSAHCVVTQRLHTILPCLAFETPVIAISGRDRKRYSGLIDLANHYTESQFLKMDINLDTPPKNPKKYLRIRKELIKKCVSFTGYKPQESFLKDKTLSELLSSASLISALAKGVGDSNLFELLTCSDNNLKHDLAETKERLMTADQTITNLKNQISQYEVTMEDLRHPGIRLATKNLLSACKNFLAKKLRK